MRTPTSPLTQASGLGSAKERSGTLVAGARDSRRLISLRMWLLGSIIVHDGSDYTAASLG